MRNEKLIEEGNNIYKLVEYEDGSMIKYFHKFKVPPPEVEKPIEVIDEERRGRIENFKSKAFNSNPINITNVMLARALIDVYEELKGR